MLQGAHPFISAPFTTHHTALQENLGTETREKTKSMTFPSQRGPRGEQNRQTPRTTTTTKPSRNANNTETLLASTTVARHPRDQSATDTSSPSVFLNPKQASPELQTRETPGKRTLATSSTHRNKPKWGAASSPSISSSSSFSPEASYSETLALLPIRSILLLVNMRFLKL
ncbi:hypothetical protein SUGI_1133380 [Cryptomeria japonica]|nr:hypothetical protein SUGI_1133380 [Cryptomeria japonica]